jgi:hypothetical protein
MIKLDCVRGEIQVPEDDKMNLYNLINDPCWFNTYRALVTEKRLKLLEVRYD